MWLPPPASYSTVKAQTYAKPLLSAFYTLPGDFWWNDITFGSIPIMQGQVTSFRVMWPPPPASYSPVGDQTYTKPEFSAFYRHFQVSSSEYKPPTKVYVSATYISKVHVYIRTVTIAFYAKQLIQDEEYCSRTSRLQSFVVSLHRRRAASSTRGQ